MAVNAQTIETYDNTLIREDLQDAYSMISPEECPFQEAIGTRTVDQPQFDWPTVDLAQPSMTNRVPEGEDAPAIDSGTLAVRWNNVTQISDKVVKVSHTSQATDAAAQNIQRLMTQVSIKIREMKRDMEMMLLQNIAAVDGPSGDSRVTAGFQAWLQTNVIDGGGLAADPVFTGPAAYGGTVGTAAVAGTPAAINEAKFNDLIEQCWNQGANPAMVLCNGGNKRVISQTFVGNATRYQDAPSKEVFAAIDFYDSDFGRMTVVPTRFLPTLDQPATSLSFSVLIIDPEYAQVAFLDNVQRKPLAETGHTMNTLVWAEYGLQVDNEKAHGIYRDTTNAA